MPEQFYFYIDVRATPPQRRRALLKVSVDKMINVLGRIKPGPRIAPISLGGIAITLVQAPFALKGVNRSVERCCFMKSRFIR